MLHHMLPLLHIEELSRPENKVCLPSNIKQETLPFYFYFFYIDKTVIAELLKKINWLFAKCK